MELLWVIILYVILSNENFDDKYTGINLIKKIKNRIIFHIDHNFLLFFCKNIITRYFVQQKVSLKIGLHTKEVY